MRGRKTRRQTAAASRREAAAVFRRGLEQGDNVTVRLADGALRCRVEAKQGGENDGRKKEVL